MTPNEEKLARAEHLLEVAYARTREAIALIEEADADADAQPYRDARRGIFRALNRITALRAADEHSEATKR